MKTTWVLVAENSRARLFNWKSLNVLDEIKTFSHPESRLHEQDLVSDKRGRSFDSAGYGRHAQEAPTSARQHESETFAKEIVAELDQCRSRNKYEKLFIIAAPHFLGQLRDEMSPSLHKAVVQEISKNMAQQPTEDIRKHLPDSLPL